MRSMIVFDWINGLTVGLEHLAGEEDEEDEIAWAIVLSLFVIRLSYVKLK